MNCTLKFFRFIKTVKELRSLKKRFFFKCGQMQNIFEHAKNYQYQYNEYNVQYLVE